ncbi:NAD(P)-dependent glycerol-3-phosphate dehydrogenase [Seohaeicola saemankumensis]|uniref:NAD(P)H-dependent glycerol-3-phosphate dehydrogenase n=1 Tax=Seohaeicola saemankumensis TaxID=481181 RepID=UPI001E3483BC|nr:NAD(P)H-dependent glycerol-3-phosphate dehydrogenase [Seohaeicola saemankumensis]MCD1625011.1 NAD(P)-dependent glycerol-3-phosphate dehydrogenase [Seohaeicola saemankumensis]
MITVLGSGAFGTALAISLAEAGKEVSLWSRDPAQVQTMQNTRENALRLPGVVFPENLLVTAKISQNSGPVLLAVPMQKLRDLLNTETDALYRRDLVACCKGIELSTTLGPVAIIRELMPDNVAAILTGPSFASDIARGLPTALTLACADAEKGKTLQATLTTGNLRIYRSTDTIGAELGGALKNVIAIAAGAVIGAGLGDSARAALMTRGYAEMQRLAQALGARPETLSGLSGFGDLVLTCNSPQSRNMRFGLSLGRNEAFDPAITVEGAATARAALKQAETLGLDMPITAAVVALLDGKVQLRQAMEMLLSRPLKEE